MSVLPKAPDTWSLSVFRTLLCIDLVFILFSAIVVLGCGPHFYWDREPMDWERFCDRLLLWTGLLLIIDSSFFWVKKQRYACAGTAVGLLSIYISLSSWPNIK